VNKRSLAGLTVSINSTKLSLVIVVVVVVVVMVVVVVVVVVQLFSYTGMDREVFDATAWNRSRLVMYPLSFVSYNI